MYISDAGIGQKKTAKNQQKTSKKQQKTSKKLAKNQHGNGSEWTRIAQGRLLLGYRGPVRCPGNARDTRSSSPSSSWHYEASNSRSEHPGWTGPTMVRIMDFVNFPKIMIFFEKLKSSNRFLLDPTPPRACIRGGKRLPDTLVASYSRPTRRCVPSRCVQYHGFHKN